MKTRSNEIFNIVKAESRENAFGGIAAPSVCCCMCCTDTGGLRKY